MRINYQTTILPSTLIIIVSNTKGLGLFQYYRYRHLTSRSINRYNNKSSFMTSISTTKESNNNDDNSNDNQDKYQWENYKDEAIMKCILPLSYTTHKGISGGRIGIIGGNELYVGAPYFTGMSALNTGADLITIYTANEASIPLKCYSPDLMIQSIYNTSEIQQYNDIDNDNNDTNESNKDTNDNIILKDMVKNMELYIQQRSFHCIIIGPGMGRHPIILSSIVQIIRSIIKMNLYLILDADALYILSLSQYCTILQGYNKVIITPNKVEYERIMSMYHIHKSTTNEDMLQNVIIVQKGYVDTIWYNHQILYQCNEIGGMKRCGGIGDVLVGTIGTFIAWQAIMMNLSSTKTTTNTTTTNDDANNNKDKDDTMNVSLACYMACCLIKRATKNAFDLKKRSMSAQDIIEQIGTTYESMINT